MKRNSLFQKEREMYSFHKVVVWDLREEMVYNMGSNVMVDVIEHSIVSIHSCQPSS